MRGKIDKRILKLGFVKTVENKFCVIYERNIDGYLHKVALIYKTSGRHLIQSYDPTLCDEQHIGNTSVGLTYKENRLFLKKMKRLGWK